MSIVLDPRAAVVDSRAVRTVRVVAHTLGAAGPDTSDNHWSIYLLLEGNASIRVNMRADPGYIDGQLDFTAQNYQMTTSAIANFDIPTVGHVQVASLLRKIYENRRNVYEMSGGGSGCRYWVWVIISDWAKSGFIASGAGTQLWPDLLFLYHKNQPRKPLPMVVGTFNPAA